MAGDGRTGHPFFRMPPVACLGKQTNRGADVTATTTARPRQPAWIAALDQLQGTVDEALRGIASPHVLEAGCGSAAHVRFPRAHSTGIDIDPHQLERNTACSETILGDIETYDLPASSYDAIVCWYVFEHLNYP